MFAELEKHKVGEQGTLVEDLCRGQAKCEVWYRNAGINDQMSDKN